MRKRPFIWRRGIYPKSSREAGRDTPEALRTSSPSFIRCLAPDWVYLAMADYSPCGGLLPRLFTLTLAGGLFSAALSMDEPCGAPPVFSDGILLCGVRTFLSQKNLPRADARSPTKLRFYLLEKCCKKNLLAIKMKL